MATKASNVSTSPEPPAGSVEMPRPTAWPIVLSLGVTMIALGIATSLAFSVVGGALLVVGLIGWISQLLPGRGHEHEPLSSPEERAEPIAVRRGMVQQLKPGVVGYRFQLPEKVHPISAGIKGGIVGGLLMPIPALTWALLSGHSIWFPVNLLAGLVLPSLPDMSIELLHKNLDIFHPWGFVCAILMHAFMSVGFGLIGGVLLPTLPPIFGGPLLFGGVVLPLLWSGASHSMMGVVNPLMNQYIDWPWYVASQLVYGIATSIVIVRSEEIAIAPRGPGGDSGGPSIPPGWLGCLLAVCLLNSGCTPSEGVDKLKSFSDRPIKSDEFTLPQDVKNFHDLYALRCAGCHGADGTLGPGPPLNDPMFAALMSEDELQKVIAAGRLGTLMPAWAQSSGGPLTDAQVGILAEGIKQRKWDSAEKSSAAANVYPAAPPLTTSSSTHGNVKDGQRVYAIACESCHGPNGDGGKEGGSIHDHAFLALSSDQILRRYIITGRPDLGMPDFADGTGRGKDYQPLTAQQVSDLVALLAAWRSETDHNSSP